MEKIGLKESFKPLEKALKEKSLTDPAYIKLLEDFEILESEYQRTLKSAEAISPSLSVSVQANLTKITNTHDRIKTKYRAHLKRAYEDLTNHKLEILSELFPDGKMQERYENYLELVCRFKVDLIPYLLREQKALNAEYLILTLD